MMTMMMTTMMTIIMSHLSRLLRHDLDLLLISAAGDGADNYFDQGLHSLERRRVMIMMMMIIMMVW